MDKNTIHPVQLEFDFANPFSDRVNETKAIRSGLKVIQGGGQKRREELKSRDAVIHLLVGAGADLLLKRISSERAEEIQLRVDSVLEAFDLVDQNPAFFPALEAKLKDLENFMNESQGLARPRHRASK